MGKAGPENSVDRKLLKRPLLLLAGLGAAWLIVLCLVGENGLASLMRRRTAVRSLEQEIEALRCANSSLKEEIRLLKNDNSTIEAYAREELFMLRPGEKAFCVIPQKPTQTQ